MGFLPARRIKANDEDDVDVDGTPGVNTTPVTPAPNP